MYFYLIKPSTCQPA